MSLSSLGDLYGIKHMRMRKGSRQDGVLQVPEESQVSGTEETAPCLPPQCVSQGVCLITTLPTDHSLEAAQKNGRWSSTPKWQP